MANCSGVNVGDRKREVTAYSGSTVVMLWRLMHQVYKELDCYLKWLDISTTEVFVSGVANTDKWSGAHTLWASGAVHTRYGQVEWCTHAVGK